MTNTESADAGNESQADSSSASKTVSSAATGKMKVSESIRLRKSESTDSEVLEMIYAGGTVNVIEQYANGWAKVEYNKKTGYIKSEFLTKD